MTAHGGTHDRAARLAQHAASNRSKLIGAIHAVAAKRGISDDTRRDLIERLTGKRSAKDLTLPELGQVLDELNRGWKPVASGLHRSHIGKARALWWSLYWLGELNEPGDRALSAFVERQTGIAALRFLDHRNASSVIEALKAMLGRAGVMLAPSGQAGGSGDETGLADRHAVLAVLWERLRQRGAIGGFHYADYLGNSLGIGREYMRWDKHTLDAGHRVLGKKLRRAMGLAAHASDSRGDA
ncbi:MAG TPA: regulatory protein GemA [Polymorphobacter sp.]|nr:regulatory protein GemA [Polymorphobacter sp.]